MAEYLTSLHEIVGVERSLDVSHELGELALTESGVQCETTLDGQRDNREQKGKDHRNDDTTFVDRTPHVTVDDFTVSGIDVIRVTEEILEETYCENEADSDDPECSFYSLKALTFFGGGCFFL